MAFGTMAVSVACIVFSIIPACRYKTWELKLVQAKPELIRAINAGGSSFKLQPFVGDHLSRFGTVNVDTRLISGMVDIEFTKIRTLKISASFVKFYVSGQIATTPNSETPSWERFSNIAHLQFAVELDLKEANGKVTVVAQRGQGTSDDEMRKIIDRDSATYMPSLLRNVDGVYLEIVQSAIARVVPEILNR